jgi:hypothetical protein
VSYRPICDLWILARPKVKYYGAYPNGFLERGRALLSARRHEPVLHVCGGHAKAYPTWATLCPHDRTLDLDAATHPDYVQDARAPLPQTPTEHGWPAIICDPPYTETDAAKYQPGAAVFPLANQLLKNALAAVRVGGRVGMLHYVLPQPPREGVKFVACVGVIAGYNNRMRVYSVFERLT